MFLLQKYTKFYLLIFLLAIIFNTFICKPIYFYYYIKSSNHIVNNDVSKLDIKVFKTFNMSFYKNIHLNTVSGLKYITNNYHVLNTYSINNITYYLCVSNIEKDKESILKEIINNFIDSTSNFASNSSLMFSLTNGALLWFEDFFKLDITLACKSISYFYFDNVVLNSFISTPLKPPIL